MASVSRTTTHIVDDITGAEGAVTRQVTIDGKVYEIDLAEATINKYFRPVNTRKTIAERRAEQVADSKKNMTEKPVSPESKTSDRFDKGLLEVSRNYYEDIYNLSRGNKVEALFGLMTYLNQEIDEDFVAAMNLGELDVTFGEIEEAVKRYRMFHGVPESVKPKATKPKARTSEKATASSPFEDLTDSELLGALAEGITGLFAPRSQAKTSGHKHSSNTAAPETAHPESEGQVFTLPMDFIANLLGGQAGNPNNRG